MNNNKFLMLSFLSLISLQLVQATTESNVSQKTVNTESINKYDSLIKIFPGIESVIEKNSNIINFRLITLNNFSKNWKIDCEFTAIYITMDNNKDLYILQTPSNKLFKKEYNYINIGSLISLFSKHDTSKNIVSYDESPYLWLISEYDHDIERTLFNHYKITQEELKNSKIEIIETCPVTICIKTKTGKHIDIRQTQDANNSCITQLNDKHYIWQKHYWAK